MHSDLPVGEARDTSNRRLFHALFISVLLITSSTPYLQSVSDQQLTSRIIYTSNHTVMRGR